jgi:molecular chaperone HscB
MPAGPSLAADDFALFGLPRRFALDREALDMKWKALQGAAHPDRHASGTAPSQRLAMQWAMRINEAYRRLREPLARAAYLCRLHGEDVAAEDNTAMPADFLMQQMAWRESLAEAARGDEVEAIAAEVNATRRDLLASVQAQVDEARSTDWPTVAAAVRRLMFVERLVADIDRRLESLQD